MTGSDCSTSELIAISIARQMRHHDGDWVSVGAFSQLPAAALKLARILYAPNLSWLSGPGGAVNSSSRLVASTSDHRVLRGAECILTMEDVVDLELWPSAREDKRIVAVVGGIQIDKHGSTNMVCVGEYANPRVRGVGTVGLCFGVSWNAMYLFSMQHNPRVFVDRVDFVSSPGHTPERAQYVPPSSEGPRLVFSPLGIFDFASAAGTMRICSLHPGVTVDEVQSKTGFAVVVPEHLAVTEAPTAHELAVLRTEIDPDGVLDDLRVVR
jgi:glutaconate CoA-transferase, subunit B